MAKQRAFGRVNIPIEQTSEAERASVLHIINRPRSLTGEGRAASQSGEGSECCFWRAACFRSEVIAWNGRRVQSFPPLKANYSETGGAEAREHAAFSRETTPRLTPAPRTI